MLVGLPGCGKSTVAAAIAGVQDCAARTSIVENSEGNGSSRMSDISQSDLNLHTDHDDELPPPFRDIEVEEEGQQEQEQEQEHHNQSQRKWVVTCQDILKTRKKVLQVANGALMNGHSVIFIDRTIERSIDPTYYTVTSFILPSTHHHTKLIYPLRSYIAGNH